MSGEVVWVAAGVAGWLLIALTLAPVVGRLLGGEPPMPPPDPYFDADAEQTLAMIRDLPLYDALAALQAIDLDREWFELDEASNGGPS